MFRRNLNRLALAAMCGIGSVALVACVEERVDIPAGAQEMSAGDKRLTFTATQPGSVLIEDMNSQSIVYRGRVAINDTVTLDPDKNAVTLNSTIVTDKALHGGDQYRILFVAETEEGHPI